MCSDIDHRNGVLLIDTTQRLPNNQSENYIKRYQGTQLLQKQPLEGNKEMLKFFHDHVIEVKTVAKTGIAAASSGQTQSQLSIYDFKNKITLFWTTTQGNIMHGCLEVENDAIYYLTQNYVNNRIERELIKLYEMEDNVKIHNLMKKNQYAEALTIAKDANFPNEIQCEIIKENADKLFNQKKYDDAIK